MARGEKIGHLDIIEGLGPWAGEDRVDPAHAFLVVFGLAVRVERLRRLEDFIDDEAVVVVRIAQDVEAQITGLLARAFVVYAERLRKSAAWPCLTLMLTIWMSMS